MDKLKHTLYIFSLLILPVFLKAQNRLINAIRPDYINLQYGGSIGYVSGGIGYFFFNNKTTASLHYGFVPEDKGGSIHILTTKFDYKPFNLKLGKNLVYQPLNPVIFISYSLGRHFDKEFDPDQYPEGYYWWSTALKTHLGFSMELKLYGAEKSALKAVSLYAETNTNDLYAVSWFENRTTTSITRIFFMGYGIRLHL